MLMLLSTCNIKKHKIIRKNEIVRNTTCRSMFTRDENGYLNSRAGIGKVQIKSATYFSMSCEVRMDLTFLNGWKKKNNILWHENYEIQISMSTNNVLLGHIHFFYILSMTAFVIYLQYWVGATESLWPVSLNFYCPALYTKSLLTPDDQVSFQVKNPWS